MNISSQAQAVLLLTTWFSRPSSGDPKPLSATEWGRFALWLREQGAVPELLLSSNDPADVLKGWTDQRVTTDRIIGLLRRAGALGLALEKWERAGIWVMTRSDPDYPSRLKRQLKTDAPPVLFGCGDRQLLDRGGIAVIGSRDAIAGDLSFASTLGGEIAAQGHSVVSGGARGVDESAMLGALAAEGTVIGVLAEGLLRAITSAKYRPWVMAKNLALVSPYSPEASFDVGNAMGRNKYIYCLADAAVVVATGKASGGTWSGAVENLKRAWVPLWVKPQQDATSGNEALVARGGRWLPEGALVTDSLVDTLPGAVTTGPGLFEVQTAPPVGGGREPDFTELPVATPMESAADSLTLYDLFLRSLEAATRAEALTPVALGEKLGLEKAQVAAWLKRALAEGHLEKLTKPVRYQSSKRHQGALDL